MKSLEFDRKDHVYKNDAFAELVKDAIRFFNGTPVHPLPTFRIILGNWRLCPLLYWQEPDL